MRTDKGLGLERVEDLPGLGVPGRFFEDGVSQSGNERNHLFSHLRTDAVRFRDVSGVSGLDHPADGRAFAWLDFDRDGWLDVAAVNANTPLLQLFHNEMGAFQRSGQRGALVVELEGGGRPGATESGWSNRDAIGARVSVTDADGRMQVRELRAGEGLAAQNAGRLHFGLGADERVSEVAVQWPSGRRTIVADVAAGSLLRISERGDVASEPWARAAKPLPASRPTEDEPSAPFAVAEAAGEMTAEPAGAQPALRVFTSFATWCSVCLGELPQVALLRDAFAPEAVRLDGIPVDPEDTTAKLEQWVRKNQPAYRVRSDWSPERRAEVADLLARTLRSEGLPATVITDGSGKVLHTQWGVPTLSTLRALGAPARSAAAARPAS